MSWQEIFVSEASKIDFTFFPKLPKGSKRYRKVQKSTKRYIKVHKGTKRYKKGTKRYITLHKVTLVWPGRIER